jgi:hypothetical protein
MDSEEVEMNERIKELSKEAWAWAEQQEYTDPTKEFSDILEQKFAELIIRECMSVARGMRNPPNLNYKPSDRFVDELQLHFGVKE